MHGKCEACGEFLVSEEREDGSRWLVCKSPECKESPTQIRRARIARRQVKVSNGSAAVASAF